MSNEKSKSETNLIVKVIDYNYKPVNQAVVTLTSKDEETRLQISDKKGTYGGERIASGEYRLAVKAEGYAQQERQVHLEPGRHKEPFFLGHEKMPFYYRGNVKVPFEPIEHLVAVVMSEDVGAHGSQEQRNVAQNIARELGLEHYEVGENITLNGFYIYSLTEPVSQDRWREIIEIFQNQEGVKAAGPLLKLFEKNATVLTNELIVRFRETIDDDEIKRMADAYEFTVHRRFKPLGKVYKVAVQIPASYDVLDVCNRIAEEKNVVYAEPNLFHTVEDDAYTPNDYLFPEQWDHELIRTPQAWQILRDMDQDSTFGNADIVIAVVDSGVDSSHPEFDGTLSNGASKTYQQYDFENMVDNNNSRPSNHGTCCASAVTAMANNSSSISGVNEGVCGVAGNCQLVGIRRGGDEARYSGMYLWTAGMDAEAEHLDWEDIDEDIREDFPDQITPGADIITNSFGYSIGSPISGLMSDTFDKLTDDGRDGKGVLLFFSAGNGDSDLDLNFARPWGMYERCFSIAASSLDDDGVTEIRAAYSNYGSDIEFCAPSHDEYVGTAPLHDPPENYGAFTAMHENDNSATAHPTVGRPTNQTALDGTANAGDTTLTVNSTTGFANDQAILIGDPGNNGTEGHRITNVDSGNNELTVNRSLLNDHSSGENVYSTGSDYRSNFGGTSYATPVAAGVAALILSFASGLSWTQVRDFMRDNAVKIDPNNSDSEGRWRDKDGNISSDPNYTQPHFSEFYGYGRLDAEAVLSSLSGCSSLIKKLINLILGKN